MQRNFTFIIIASNAAILAVSLLSGCATCETNREERYDTCDFLPVQHWELEGTWCDTRSPQTCLTVEHPPSSSAAAGRYTLTRALCAERGSLTGGLEFSPDTSSRICLPGFSYGLWSASGEWSSVGLDLLDPNQSDGTEAGTVHAEDLHLEYRK